MHWHWLRPVPKRLIFTIKLTHHTENIENSRFQEFKGWLWWRNEIGWKEKSRPLIDRTGLHFCTTHHPPMTICLADKQVLTLSCNKPKRWWCASKQSNILKVMQSLAQRLWKSMTGTSIKINGNPEGHYDVPCDETCLHASGVVSLVVNTGTILVIWTQSKYQNTACCRAVSFLVVGNPRSCLAV